ncbi:thiamine phosphate synthase [Litorimonas haliclonae]|uniref:thiamine phosphate synthase n=1 Tax=Litorimonas haliclonae TaxID=2081977 RepID=UPI0039F054BF
MTSPYETWPGLGSHPLGRHALKLREVCDKSCRLSPLIAMSDPVRTPDVIGWARALPKHCAVIYRYDTFDESLAKELRKVTTANSQQLLIRSQSRYEFSDGQHFKRDTDLALISEAKRKFPDALLTLAALKKRRYKAPLPDIDGLLVSAIFPSKSPSAGTPIGVETLKERTKEMKAPVFALGGINTKTAPALFGTNVAGIAAIGALREDDYGR